jgi:dUTP pyrophosphatase
MNVRIENRSPHPLPAYETAGAAGLDLRAWLPEAVTLQPLERRAIPTGLYLELPMGFEGQVRPRSGLSLKRGLTVINSPGTIDPDYRGEVMIPVVNLSGEPQQIADGDRIAQLVIARFERIDWEQVKSVTSDTGRSSGGFGSTGI